MHVIIGLFLLGFLVAVAMFVFNIVLSAGLAVVGGVVAGCVWVVNKVRGK